MPIRVDGAPCSYARDTSCDPTQLPGFEAGHFVVQDEASQLISEVVNLKRVSAYSMPARRLGKSMALADAMPSLTLVAVESDSERTQRMRENFRSAPRSKQELLSATRQNQAIGGTNGPSIESLSMRLVPRPALSADTRT